MVTLKLLLCIGCAVVCVGLRHQKEMDAQARMQLMKLASEEGGDDFDWGDDEWGEGEDFHEFADDGEESIPDDMHHDDGGEMNEPEPHHKSDEPDPTMTYQDIFEKVQKRRESMRTRLESNKDAAGVMRKKLQDNVEEVPSCSGGWYFSSWRRSIRSIKDKLEDIEEDSADLLKDLMKIEEFKGSAVQTENLKKLRKSDQKSGKLKLEVDEQDYKRIKAAIKLEQLIVKCQAETSH
uniref:RxLR effector protein n=1 Tax=Chromera velia CCMP2878 TaxID=1169474 RepID=A0A0G4F4J4_9ALVE|eukprot:Cvel_15088.t1-p1 / transcript=Cvel_15088.t1 / gene=Cvel_15088 / organism=Chromera_velia_CCMP2878 / gene_product=hypothetical protein / transcript_product=hypothetical protein / location=Cvel_scaffold1101:1885-2589(-) / protein_length=235 / sequence_SO=supercontig / SO=protein_coding / is_pseudo=false